MIADHANSGITFVRYTQAEKIGMKNNFVTGLPTHFVIKMQMRQITNRWYYTLLGLC